MEVAMRWVYQQVKDKYGTPLEAGQKPSLCFKGRKNMLCVAAGHPVRVFKRPARDFDACRQVSMSSGGEYPIERAVLQFQQIAQRNGITEGARKLLQRAAEMADDINEDDFNDEEELMMKTTEKPAAEVDTAEATGDTSPAVETNETSETPTKQETSDMATATSSATKKTRARKDKPAGKKAAAPKVKRAAKSNGANGAKKERKPYTPSPESRIGKAVAYMRDEIKKAGGMSKLERGFLKELFEKTSKKIGVAKATCSTQYNAQIRSKG